MDQLFRNLISSCSQIAAAFELYRNTVTKQKKLKVETTPTSKMETSSKDFWRFETVWFETINGLVDEIS